ncbi:hypothetical protein RchiOBHm_Chr5g0077721 [Rosa chinensis]|uniref:Uncharacterized protein n=1 Tax=Rosa chinensis TaxID=74649 RepID=A0A2P6QM26_ROSCH|nr:hypothetical protein RchiOBHm_Chr5g0077721 [Rosa chinensis]
MIHTWDLLHSQQPYTSLELELRVKFRCMINALMFSSFVFVIME